MQNRNRDIKKPIIYQLLVRLFNNPIKNPVFNGEREKNGCGKINAIDLNALAAIQKLGATHIWFTGVIEHAHTKGYPEQGIPNDNPIIIKGKAGSPYAIKDYYDIDPDIATSVPNRIHEFEQLVARTHKQGLKVIIDFVPNHLFREYDSDINIENIKDFGSNDDVSKDFLPSNNFYYIQEPLTLPEDILQRFPMEHYNEFPAKVTGNDHFSSHPSSNDWYETVKLNYGRDYLHREDHFEIIPDTWKKMLHILTYWSAKGVDGFRCDMAEMVPVSFWEWVIPLIKTDFPDTIFIAEIYQPHCYHNYLNQGHFDYLYDKVGLYDSLRRILCNNGSVNEITAHLHSLHGIEKKMLCFLENHDEQRIASSHFLGDPFKAIPAMMVSATLHQGPLLIYFGQEFGEAAAGASGFSGDDGRTTIFDYWHVPELEKWINNGKYNLDLLTKEQKRLYTSYQEIMDMAQLPAVVMGNHYDLMYYNEHLYTNSSGKIFCYLRYTDDDRVLFVANFSGHNQEISLKIPRHALNLMGIDSQEEISISSTKKTEIIRLTVKHISLDGIQLHINAHNYLCLSIS